jgi:PST family polysaccharide transporter
LTFQRTLLGAVVNVILNLIFIPRFGPIGAAIATVVAYAIAAFLSDLVQKETKHVFMMKLGSMNIFKLLYAKR